MTQNTPKPWRVGWQMIGDTVSWFEFDTEHEAREYFEAVRHARESSQTDERMKNGWLQRWEGDGWEGVEGPLPVPATFENGRSVNQPERT